MRVFIGAVSILAFVGLACPCCGKEVRADDTLNPISKTYTIEGMTCGGCEVGLKISLKKAGFTKNIQKLSHKTGTLEMQFDAKEFTKETDCKVIKAIQEKGYLAYTDAAPKGSCH